MSEWNVDSVTYKEYDSTYPRAFDRVTSLVHEALPEAVVEHVGSTSVPGLGGRGVLDIVVVCKPEICEAARRRLLGVGFKDVPFRHNTPMLTTSVRVGGVDYPVIAYILPGNSTLVRGWKALREYMSRHPEEACRYAQAKRSALEGKADARRYQAAKAPYLEELSRRIAHLNDAGRAEAPLHL